MRNLEIRERNKGSSIWDNSKSEWVTINPFSLVKNEPVEIWYQHECHAQRYIDNKMFATPFGAKCHNTIDLSGIEVDKSQSDVLRDHNIDEFELWYNDSFPECNLYRLQINGENFDGKMHVDEFEKHIDSKRDELYKKRHDITGSEFIELIVETAVKNFLKE